MHLYPLKLRMVPSPRGPPSSSSACLWIWRPSTQVADGWRHPQPRPPPKLAEGAEDEDEDGGCGGKEARGPLRRPSCMLDATSMASGRRGGSDGGRRGPVEAAAEEPAGRGGGHPRPALLNRRGARPSNCGEARPQRGGEACAYHALVLTLQLLFSPRHRILDPGCLTSPEPPQHPRPLWPQRCPRLLRRSG
ncbi:hypothetical protein BS78_03G018500 [Paspalum vaginatum]|nr:hypothetical protein BS78_03G018500 [Paspalum vaginatum]